MTTPLDHLVAQAVHHARTMERALHDKGEWTITVGDQTALAQRVVLPTGVQFTAWFNTPAEGSTASLEVDGETISVRDHEGSSEGIQWLIEIPTAVRSR